MKFSLRIKALLYNAGVALYTLLEGLASAAGHVKARKRRIGLKRWADELAHWRDGHRGQLWWIHAASLGEYEMAVPLLRALREKYPEYVYLVSFFSASGYEQKKNSDLAEGVFYLPADNPTNVKKWFDLLSPDGFIFIKYDIWLNYLFEGKRRQIPSYLVNAVFRKSQRFFHHNSIFMEGLKTFDHIFVQLASSEKLLRTHGLVNVSTTGDLRVERVTEIAAKKEEVPCIANYKGECNLLMGGSTWPVEEQLLAEVMKELKDWKLVVFPHEFGEQRKKQLQQTFADFEPVFWSEDAGYQGSGRVYIIDTVGMLSKSYRYARVALVGGGFSGKLHNILEPLAFGVPVFIGPKTSRFEEAQVFEEKGMVVKVNTAQGLLERLKALSAEKKDLGRMPLPDTAHILKVIESGVRKRV